MDNARIASDYENPEIAVVTQVTGGSGAGNRFSVSLDTGNLPAAEHILVVSDVKGSATGSNSIPGSFTGTAMFNIIAKATGNRASPEMTWDSISKSIPLLTKQPAIS